MDLKKKFNTGDFLDYSVDIFKNNYKKYFAMVLIFHVPVMFIINLIMGDNNIFLNSILSDAVAEAAEADTIDFVSLMLYQLGSLLSSIYNLIFVNVLTVASIKLTYDLIIYNASIKTKELLKYGFSKFGWVILLSLLTGAVIIASGVIVYLIIILLVLSSMLSPGAIVMAILIFLAFAGALIYFSTRTALAVPAISIDGIGTIKALKASFRLTKKRFWKTMWPVFFGSILVMMATSIFSIVVMVIPFSSTLINRILFAVTESLAALLFPFGNIVLALLYTKYKAESGELELQLELDRMLSGN